MNYWKYDKMLSIEERTDEIRNKYSIFVAQLKAGKDR